MATRLQLRRSARAWSYRAKRLRQNADESFSREQQAKMISAAMQAEDEVAEYTRRLGASS